MSINGTFYGATANAWIKPRIQWWAEANIEGNYSEVTATLSYTRTNTGFTTSGHWAGWLSIGGNTRQVSGVYVQITNGGYTATVTHTVRVPHNDDGTCRVAISAGGGINGTTLQYTVIQGEIALEDIPRAASVSATDADIGGICKISIGRRSTLYTHTLSYSFQSLQGYLTETGISDTPVKLTADTVSFLLPESFYYAMTQAASAPCTLKCTTYLGEEIVGTPQQTTFTVRAPYEACAPLLSFRAADQNPVTLALTGDEGVFVKGASHVQCLVEGQGQFGAQIAQITLNGDPVIDGSALLEAIQTDTLRCSVRDSRSHVLEELHTYRLIPYFPPVGILQAARTDATSGEADIQVRGNWFSGSFGAQENRLQVRCRVDTGSWLALEPVPDADAYALSARLAGLEYTQSHTITVEVSDCLGTLTLSAHINPGIPVFDWGSGDFCFHVPVQASRLTGLLAPELGTDAASKDYVDTVADGLKALTDQKLSMTLLWENASPTSEFPAQTIALDLSKYDAVQVEFAESWQTMSPRINVGKHGGVDQIGDIYRDVDSYFYVAHRDIRVTTTGVSFADRLYKYANGQRYGVANQGLIPFRIYGIQGVGV